jgi:hypothetical protein
VIIFYFIFISETVRSFKLADEANEEVDENLITTEPSEQLIGKTLDEANEMIRNGQIFQDVGQLIGSFRVVREDGEWWIVTSDCEYDRMDVEIRYQKIVWFSFDC